MSLAKTKRELFLKNASKKNVDKYFRIMKRVSQHGGVKYKKMLTSDRKYLRKQRGRGNVNEYFKEYMNKIIMDSLNDKDVDDFKNSPLYYNLTHKQAVELMTQAGNKYSETLNVVYDNMFKAANNAPIRKKMNEALVGKYANLDEVSQEELSQLEKLAAGNEVSMGKYANSDKFTQEELERELERELEELEEFGLVDGELAQPEEQNKQPNQGMRYTRQNKSYAKDVGKCGQMGCTIAGGSKKRKYKRRKNTRKRS